MVCILWLSALCKFWYFYGHIHGMLHWKIRLILTVNLISAIKNKVILLCLKVFQFPFAKTFLFLSSKCYLSISINLKQRPWESQAERKNIPWHFSSKWKNQVLNCSCRQVKFTQCTNSCNYIRNSSSASEVQKEATVKVIVCMGKCFIFFLLMSISHLLNLQMRARYNSP